MRILHGENTVQSRQQLFNVISAAKAQGKQVLHVDAKTLDLPSLEQILGSQSLFAEEKIVIIEELQSLPKSKKKDDLTAELGKHAGPTLAAATSTAPEIILWEKRDLTPTMLKKFPGAVAQQFKLSSSLFTWLDNLSGQKNAQQTRKMFELLQKALTNDGDFMCFSMLSRQVRLLIQAKENNFAGLPPFMIGKLKNQAASFSLAQLLALHHKLLVIDTKQKTSQSKFNLAQELELLLLEL